MTTMQLLPLIKISTMTRKNLGFSLVEIMVVIAIIATLTALIMPFYKEQQRENNRVIAQAMLVDIMAKYNQQAFLLGANSFIPSDYIYKIRSNDIPTIAAYRNGVYFRMLNMYSSSEYPQNLEPYQSILKVDSIPNYRLFVHNRFVYQNGSTLPTQPNQNHYYSQFVLIAKPTGQQSGDGEICINNYGDRHWDGVSQCKLLGTASSTPTDKQMQGYTWFGE